MRGSSLMAGWIILVSLWFAGATKLPAAEASSERFRPVSLTNFYLRLFTSYTAKESWGSVPKGLQKFDGVPFLMEGQVELNGMGASRNRNYLPTRVGEIPIHRRVRRLHLIGGAGYKDPDDTPIAEIRLHYKGGKMRHLFITYGGHVRNWHVEVDERRTDVSDPGSRIIWNGINGATGRPIRLFKNTFENPLPQEEIQSIQFLSLFGQAFYALCALTLEDDPGSAAPPATEDPDDTAYRREALLRVVDADTGKAISNATVNVTVTDDRTYAFGRHRSDRLGQVLIDYPPGRFAEIRFEVRATQYLPLMETREDPEGVLPAEVVLRCKRGP